MTTLSFLKFLSAAGPPCPLDICVVAPNTPYDMTNANLKNYDLTAEVKKIQNKKYLKLYELYKVYSTEVLKNSSWDRSFFSVKISLFRLTSKSPPKRFVRIAEYFSKLWYETLCICLYTSRRVSSIFINETILACSLFIHCLCVERKHQTAAVLENRTSASIIEARFPTVWRVWCVGS